MIKVTVFPLIHGKKYGELDENGCFIYRSPHRHSDVESTKYRPKIMVNGVHRLVTRYIYEYTFGPIPPKNVIRHKCDNERCTLLDHLIHGTLSQNTLDALERGRLVPHRGPMPKTLRRLERAKELPR